MVVKAAVVMAEAAAVAVAQELAGKAEVTAGEVVAEKVEACNRCCLSGGENR